MLKAGNKRALLLFGYGDPSHIRVEGLTREEKIVTVGKNLHYSFQLIISGKEPSKVRLEYGIDFVKANGKLSRKIFKMSERTYEPGTYSFTKKNSFTDMSTRKHFSGKHQITIIVNGVEMASTFFELTRRS